MSINELARELSRMYDNVPEGEKVAMIHLFGIQYSKCIIENNYSSSDILRNTMLDDGSKISENYQAEINKGKNLAKYVIERKAIINFMKNN